MWKKATALALVLVFVLGLTAQAAPMRTPTKNLTLSFQGTTAICETTVRADNATDKASVTMRLWNNGRVIGTWANSGTCVVRMNESAPVVKGQSHKLTLDSTINGVKQATKSVTRTCP